MKFKHYIFLLFILSLFYINSANAAWCKYKWKIDQCMDANIAWTQRGISDFVCPSSKVYEQITFQVALDMEFKELDKEMDKYIEDLERYKNIYFWINKQKNYIDWINDIHTKKTFFYIEYLNICNNILKQEVIKCTDDEKLTIIEAEWFFMDKGSKCRVLVDKKLEIFQDITFNVLMLNKQQIKSDEKKLYDQWERRAYNKLLDIMMINFWYIERIWQKIPSLTYKPH